MADIPAITKTLVDKITPTITVTAVVDKGDGYFELTACKTHYLSVNRIIQLDGKLYQVSSFVQNTSITLFDLYGKGEPATGTITMYLPVFFYGTALAFQKEYDRYKANLGISWAGSMPPFIWLKETIEETNYSRAMSSWEFEARLRMYFMVSTEAPGALLTPDHHNDYIKPMRALADLFLGKYDADSNFHTPQDFQSTFTARAEWGSYMDAQGNLAKFLNENLSGVELKFNMIGLNGCESNCCDC